MMLENLKERILQKNNMPFVIPGVNDLKTINHDIAEEAEGWDP